MVQKASDHAHGGGLAGSIWAKETQHVTPVDSKTHIVNGEQIAEALAETLDFDQSRHGLLLRHATN